MQWYYCLCRWVGNFSSLAIRDRLFVRFVCCKGATANRVCDVRLAIAIAVGCLTLDGEGAFPNGPRCGSEEKPLEEEPATLLSDAARRTVR